MKTWHGSFLMLLCLTSCRTSHTVTPMATAPIRISSLGVRNDSGEFVEVAEVELNGGTFQERFENLTPGNPAHIGYAVPRDRPNLLGDVRIFWRLQNGKTHETLIDLDAEGRDRLHRDDRVVFCLKPDWSVTVEIKRP